MDISNLTLREKIGQTALAFVDNDMSVLEERPYGGMWSIGGLRFTTANMDNIRGERQVTAQDVKDTIKDYNRQLKVPILPAMDSNEGINHCFGELGSLMDAVAIGATDSEELAYEAGTARALQLKSTGSNWLWWPEVDLANRRSVINWGRLFSDDPDKVSRLAAAAIKGCQDQGVAATVKHFPGSDSIEYRDPHSSPNILNISYEEWTKKQGRLFQDMIDAGVYSVMVGHVAFPAYDDTKINGHYIPATVSYKLITELLKEKMGFEGVVVTDAIGMKGLKDLYDGDLKKVYVAAINAGNDVILGVGNVYIDVIEQAVKEGTISVERIDDACRRVLAMKEKLGMFAPGYTCAEESIDYANKYATESNRKIAENSLSLVCNKINLLPLNKKHIKTVTAVILSYDDEQIESLKIMKEEFQNRGAQFFVKRNLYSFGEINEISQNSDLIIYIGYLNRGLNNYFREDEKESFNYILNHGVEKSIGISMGIPFLYFDHFFSFHTFINCYNYYEETQRALVAAIYGEMPFKGGEPFRLIPEAFKYLK